MRRVVVTGLGMVSPLSGSVNSTWENLLNGLSAADKISRFDTSGFTTNYACEIKFGDGSDNTFFPDEWMDPKDQRKVDFFILPFKMVLKIWFSHPPFVHIYLLTNMHDVPAKV